VAKWTLNLLVEYVNERLPYQYLRRALSVAVGSSDEMSDWEHRKKTRGRARSLVGRQ